MNRIWDRSIPDRCSAYLGRTAISFNHQEIARMKPVAFELAVEQFDRVYVIEG